MKMQATLEYWLDDGWYVGRLLEVPGVFSQGETLEELEVNVQEAYQLMLDEARAATQPGAQTKPLNLSA